MSTTTTINDLGEAYGLVPDVDVSGLPRYTGQQRDLLLTEAYRLHFIYNAAHKTTSAVTDAAKIRIIAALPLFFEQYDAAGCALHVLGAPFAAADPCVSSPVQLAAAAATFFAGTQAFWEHEGVKARKAQLLAREAFLDACPRLPAAAATVSDASSSSSSSITTDDSDVATVLVPDMENIQDALEQVYAISAEAGATVDRVQDLVDPDPDTLAEALHDVGHNINDIHEAVSRVSDVFVCGGFQ